jgi:hypothetical protein
MTTLPIERPELTGRIQLPGKRNGQRRISLIGKIKIGGKALSKKTGKEYPVSYDYFVADGPFKPRFDKVHGENPNEIMVAFLSNDVSQVCSEKIEFRQNGKLVAYGDGKTYYAYNPQESKYMPLKGDPTELHQMLWSKYECKVSLSIKFIIPKINDVFGFWELTTRSDYETYIDNRTTSVENIKAAFDNVMDAVGTVVNVPFILFVNKHKSNDPGETRTYPVLNMACSIAKDDLIDVKTAIDNGYKNLTLLTNERVKELKGAPIADLPELEPYNPENENG